MSINNKDFTVDTAREIANANKTNDLDFYINSIRDRAGRGLFIAAFDFIPKPIEEEIKKMGFRVQRKQDNYIEVDWYIN